ncbi:molybdenum cofactor guanylyltransferase MobA [Marinimicrobium alkaliphilum]|uniref:molybdenum cofactor guanylyltransferase MobA n=1 Tax=Marinimicrobium alkaliphilum TaxID=2202654 RepID=UPI000DBA4333|nr:molybdenum cofactor guanylyltransferase MobA [Marinimicrobium alkaliphilum]
MTQHTDITGVLLAGGQARRMGGGDKCLLPLAGETLLKRSVARAQPQVSRLLLNANGSHLRFSRTGLTVISDHYDDFRGPLAGIHAALAWMKDHQPQSDWLASFACDTPFFPEDLVEELSQAAHRDGSRLAVAHSQGRMHPIFALWHKSLLDDMGRTLSRGQVPRMQDWVNARAPSRVTFDNSHTDPFFNINTPQDLYSAEEELLGKLPEALKQGA